MKNDTKPGTENRISPLAKSKVEKDDLLLGSHEAYMVAQIAVPFVIAGDDQSLALIKAEVLVRHADSMLLRMEKEREDFKGALKWRAERRKNGFRYIDDICNSFGHKGPRGARKLFLEICGKDKEGEWRDILSEKKHISGEVLSKMRKLHHDKLASRIANATKSKREKKEKAVKKKSHPSRIKSLH
jgi:hypothetical protein